jgi:hypothetical protein
MRAFPKTFSDILTVQHSWPKKGDRLLGSTGGLKIAATFAADQLARDAFLWDGYMAAGAALIDETERRPQYRFVLVYPILFNYRHGLEVAMKWLIERYGSLANVRLNPTDRDHDLWRLWKQCKEILVAAGSRGDDDESLRTVEQIVKEFHDLDGRAVALRYSKTKDGVAIMLPEGPIDLGNTQRVMEAIDNFFKGVDGMLNDVYSANTDYY